MAKHNVPIQSLIDHIKTSMDVDPWAKEMAEELLKEQEAVKVQYTAMGGLRYGACPQCDARIDNLVNPKACGFCGQVVKWDA